MRFFTLSTPLLLVAVAGCAPDEPLVTLEFPVGDGPYYADMAFDVQAKISDEEHKLDTVTARWTSSLDGEISGPTDIAEDGTVSGQVQLTAGVHTLAIAVEDKGGRVGVAQVALSVAAQNTPPSCSIDGPTEGATTAPGQPTSISLRVDDIDIGPEALILSLTSDLDGDLGPVSVDSAGMATLSTPLSTGVHQLTWIATDERGGECTVSREHNVVAPPTIAITSPLDGFVEDVYNPIVFTAQVGDERDPASDLTLSWSSNRDGVLSAEPANADGTTTLELSSLSRGSHTITLQATDLQGGTAKASVAVLVNGPPAAPQISLVPAVPVTSDTVLVFIDKDSADAEADEVTYRYGWTRNGAPVDLANAPEVPAELTRRDEIWGVTVTPSDGRLDGPIATASITIDSTPPVLSEVSLTPTTAYTNDVLTVTATATDEDEDPIDLTYEWSVNGTVIAATGPTLDGATWFDKTDTVEVSVTPSDDVYDGLAVSASATILNSAPSSPEVSTDPAYTRGGEDVICEVHVDSVDADDDTVSYTLTWTGDGVAYPSGFSGAAGPDTTTLTDDTIPADDLDLADEFLCSIVASDGTASAAASTALMVVGTPSDYGYYREFPYTSILARNYLLGHPITLTNDGTVVELGIIAKRTTGKARIGLYTDVSGQPGALVVGSALESLVAGINEYSVSPTKVKSGDYWIMAVYDSSAYVGENRSRDTVYYRTWLATSALPSSFGTPRSYSGYRHNYYVRMIE
ncbi:MAG: hypothetical protein AB8H79_15195 [Myxococcota bacterium]